MYFDTVSAKESKKFLTIFNVHILIESKLITPASQYYLVYIDPKIINLYC